MTQETKRRRLSHGSLYIVHSTVQYYELVVIVADAILFFHNFISTVQSMFRIRVQNIPLDPCRPSFWD